MWIGLNQKPRRQKRMKVRIHSQYRNVPFEIELTARDLESIEYLKGIIRAIHEFIDEITKQGDETQK